MLATQVILLLVQRVFLVLHHQLVTRKVLKVLQVVLQLVILAHLALLRAIVIVL